MLIFALKKMLRNKWMVLCLLIGAIVFVAVLSVIPTYSNAVYRHMLFRDLESQRIADDIYPGDWVLTVQIRTDDDLSESYSRASRIRQRVEDIHIPSIDLPVLASRTHYSLDRFFYHSRIRDRVQQVPIVGIENFWENVDIVLGRTPENGRSDGVLEFVMSRTDYLQSDIRLDYEFDLFTYALPVGDRQFGRAVCVGVYDPKYEEPFWFGDAGFGANAFVIDYDYLVERFVETESIFVSSLSIFYCLDFTEIRLENVGNILETSRRVRSEIHRGGHFTFSMEDTLRDYVQRRDALEFMLWVLIVPVLIILVFYIYMVSKLMISHESNEIAVLKSRGARNTQVFSVYALMSVLIAGIAFAIGPPLGLFAGRVLGLSNGFMEFVARRGLPLELSRLSFIYAGFAALVFVIIMLIPALAATRDTIVKSKRKKGRRASAPLWQKLCLDIILVALSLYALNLYSTNAHVRALADVSGLDTPVDPLVLLASSMFVLGAGLGFLRLFPFVVKLIYHLGKNVWPPMLYSTLLSISRFKDGSRFLVLFLILNIGLGLFNATAARTLNRFLEDRVRYEVGTDIVLNQTWPVEFLHFRVEVDEETGEMTYYRTGSPIHGGVPGAPAAEDGVLITRSQVREPPFDVFQRLAGVDTATKVFQRGNVRVTSGQVNADAKIMGIIPYEFGQVAWFRSDLLPTHINNYLNLMTADPSAVFLSSSMRDNHGFRVGDRVRIGWGEQSGTLDCTIYGFVDYWPSINPITQPNFIIANLNTIHRQMRIEPYSVWLGLDGTVSSYELYEALNDAEISVSSIHDTNLTLITVRNDPQLQGMNGTLTLGFLVTLGVTLIGFLIYWILSIKSRLLQFGILRAMGLSRAGLVSTLMWEQLFVSGSAIAAGFGVGILASHLFVPTLQLIYAASEQVPPFLITADISDYVVLLTTFGGMLVLGLLILAVMLRRLKPDQALKLGED